jgi:hypothetical protein
MSPFRSLRWAALGCVPLLLAVEISPAAQPAQWSAPKAARAAAQAHRIAAGESESQPEAKPAPEVVRAEPGANSAESAPARPIVVVVRPGESIPPELQALINQAPAQLSTQPNGPAPQPMPSQQSRLQSTTTAASTPASASVPAAAPLRPQSDPAQAGERRPAHSDPLLPSSANIQPGQGGIFKWPSGMRLEYAEPPQPPPQSPIAKRTKALFRQSLEVPPPVAQASASPPKAKALFSRTPAPQSEAVAAQALATAPGAKSKALLPQGQIHPNFGISNPGSAAAPATAMIHNQPATRPVPSSMTAEQSRALFARRPDGRGIDEAVLEWFQAADNSQRALFVQSPDSRSTRLPQPAIATVAAAGQASRQSSPAVQTSPAASANAAPAHAAPAPLFATESSESQPPKSKALFSKSLWPRPTEPDPLLKYIPREHEPKQDSATAVQSSSGQPASAVPAATRTGREKGSKALFPRSMFVRSQQQAPNSPAQAVATSAAAKTGPTLARVSAPEDALKEPQLVAEPVHQAVNRAQRKAAPSSGTTGHPSGANSDSTSVEQPAGARDWRPSKRRPKATRTGVVSAAATFQAGSSSAGTGVNLVGNVEKQCSPLPPVASSDPRAETPIARKQASSADLDQSELCETKKRSADAVVSSDGSLDEPCDALISDSQSQTGAADAASAREKDRKSGSSSGGEQSSSRKRNPLR